MAATFMPSARAAMALATVLLALAGSALGGAGSARAAVDPFSVSGVTVDATAATAAAARDAALAEGQRKALRQLLERLAAPSDYDRLPKLSDAEIVPLVSGFEVQEERTSAVRYLATLTYSFRPAGIRALLRNAGVAFAETASRPVLVVPVLKAAGGGAPLLWEDENVWRRQWLDHPPATGLVPVVVPTGEVEDVAALSAAQALSGDPGAFAVLLQRYDAGDVVVAEAALDAGGVAVTVRRPGVAEPIFSDRLAQTAVESQADLLRRAAVRVVQALEERWKREILVRPEQSDAGGALIVRVPLNGPRDWVELRRRLAATGFLDSVAVKSLSRREAILSLNSPGDPSQLKLVLAQRQLALEEAPDGWVLHVLGAPGGGPADTEAPTGVPAGPPSAGPPGPLIPGTQPAGTQTGARVPAPQ
ncbi:MAG TPA: DUF2066 domain-containing protein [Candidatus Sulfotelmatobacter sp.]|nr:DUF2066 domain-containing protein [Candidatus Sulfotelmatobacter sp.]